MNVNNSIQESRKAEAVGFRIPITCPLCGAIGVMFPDYSMPTVYSRCEFNCGTRGSKQNEIAGGNKNTRRLWITSACVSRYIDSRRRSRESEAQDA